MVDYRSSLSEEIIDNLRSSFGDKVFNSTIEFVDSLVACPDARTSILRMMPGNPVARSFLKVKEEFIERVEGKERDAVSPEKKTRFGLYRSGFKCDDSVK